MFSNLKPIQIEMLILFRQHLINDTYTSFIDKTKIVSFFNDIPMSTMINYMEELENKNFIKIDWMQCNCASINIRIKFNKETLEYMKK